MSAEPRSNSHVSIAVGALAFIAGAVLTQVGPLYRAVQRFDWTAVLENVAGAGIPLAITAAIGVLIGRRLSRNAALELQDALEDLNERRAHLRAERQAAERHARMEAWGDVFRICEKLLTPGPNEKPSFAAEVALYAQKKSTAEGASGVKKLPPEHRTRPQQARSLAWYECEWGERMNAHLASLTEAVESLRSEHQVENFHVVAETLKLLDQFAKSHVWRDRDIDSFVQGSRPSSRRTLSGHTVSETSHLCVQGLAHIADRQRVAPREAGNVDVELHRVVDGHQRDENLLALFAALSDSLTSGPG
ncbi:MAG: hypothetical protein ABMA25_02345 [Ilumatobacteraceae bacterium]